MMSFLCLLTVTCSHSPGCRQLLLVPPCPRDLPSDLLPGHPRALLYHCKGLLLFLCWTGHWYWLNFIRFLLAQSSSLSRSSGWQPCPRVYCVVPQLSVTCKLSQSAFTYLQKGGDIYIEPTRALHGAHSLPIVLLKMLRRTRYTPVILHFLPTSINHCPLSLNI